MFEIIGKISLGIHIIAGASTLLAGPVAIFYHFKNPKKHRAAGKIFFYAMLVVAVSSFSGFIKHPDRPFYQLLLGIAVLVLAGIFRGVRSISLMKGGRVSSFDFAYTLALGLNGAYMLDMSLHHFLAGTMIAIPVLFAVFGAMCLGDTATNWKVFRAPATLHPLDWLDLHKTTMLGAFTASTTAFTVNAAHFLPWYLQWFGPTLLLLPLQVYFGRKLKNMRRNAAVVRVATE